jgi:hypothetical protein
LLEVQEGALFDKDGNVILDTPPKYKTKFNRSKVNFRILQFKGGWPTLIVLAPVIAILGIITLAVGTILLIFLLIRYLFFKQRAV